MIKLNNSYLAFFIFFNMTTLLQIGVYHAIKKKTLAREYRQLTRRLTNPLATWRPRQKHAAAKKITRSRVRKVRMLGLRFTIIFQIEVL